MDEGLGAPDGVVVSVGDVIEMEVLIGFVVCVGEGMRMEVGEGGSSTGWKGVGEGEAKGLGVMVGPSAVGEAGRELLHPLKVDAKRKKMVGNKRGRIRCLQCMVNRNY